MVENEVYFVDSDGVKAKITVGDEGDYVLRYNFEIPKVSEATKAILNQVRENLIKEVSISIKEFVDPKEYNNVKNKFRESAERIIKEILPELKKEDVELLTGMLLHEMLGLGEMEILLSDPHLEEIVVNGSNEPVWVYHRKYGWLKTNLVFNDESRIYNFSSMMARRVGKQISNLNPLLDVHLPTGDRANATLFPISSSGNTITIRKFARTPWTITTFIKSNTLSYEVASLLWLAMQYELNILVSGGTGSGKTSLLNVLLTFIPPNQRVVSIEDTREINLPEFLHWVPLTTREPNPENKGGVSMLDLLVNSLRMRPDRIVVGEIRKRRQAEVLFEAMNTGHSVYATLHADTSQQTIRRLVNPPLSIPSTLIDAVDLNVVMFRDRRRNIRRVMEVAEFIPEYGSGFEASANVLYRWHTKQDKLIPEGRSMKFYGKLELLVGFTPDEIREEIRKRVDILKWMCKNNVDDLNSVGKIVAEFYKDEENVLKIVEKNGDVKKLLKR